MNRHLPPADIDAHLRRHFAPDQHAIARVLVRVRQSPGSTPRLPRPAWRLTVGLVMLVLALTMVWMWQAPANSELVDSPLTIEGDRELVVVERSADGQRWAVVSAEGETPAGNYVIVLER